jgi:calcium/calmodulin-dependent protein kinase I
LGTHRATKKKIAVKCVQRKNLPPSDDVAIHSEVGILGALRHEYICPIIDFFMEDECYYIVMELMEGGDVFDKVGKLESYDESIARDLCYKMLKGISFCHEQNIAHCDLKPKNLLLKTKDDDTGVMLADFGFATTVFAPKSLKKQCGTPYFVAPEILLREPYDQQADMWSVGVIIYCILSGQLPFTGRRHLDLFKAIIAGEFDFDGGWGDVSDDAKDLICKLLVTDPSKRYTAEDALRCKWFRTNDTLLRRNSLFNASSKLKTFNARLKFKSAILMLQSLSRWKLMTKRSVEKRNEEAKAQE